ncbi:MAG: flagellar export chaperone FliS [Nitrosomonadales bacterium]|nr:flagellar export chaperone FliS [Nitrosomonadales bacterium]
MNMTTAISAYTKVGIESVVSSADPHQLISMLFQGALQAVANAKNGIKRNDIPAKGAAISKAIAIIGEGLHASLDKNVGGELAQNLSSLYDYMVLRLITANLKNDTAMLDEVTALLADLKSAWDGIRQPVAAAMPAVAPQLAAASNKVQQAYGRV